MPVVVSCGIELLRWSLPAGQVLNAAVYRKLGKAGVYYGFKLGRPIPWETGFPFNTVRCTRTAFTHTCWIAMPGAPGAMFVVAVSLWRCITERRLFLTRIVISNLQKKRRGK